MTTAQDILSKISGACAVTLSGGYAMFLMPGKDRVLFEPAKVVKEKKRIVNNDKGPRVVLGEYRYKDGSGIRFKLFPGRGHQYDLLPTIASKEPSV